MLKTISLTPEDLERGRPSDGGACPITLAARRAGFLDPFTGRSFLSWGEQMVWPPPIDPMVGAGRRAVDLPPEAARFTLEYDRCFRWTTKQERAAGAPDHVRDPAWEMPAPISFTVEVPDDA